MQDDIRPGGLGLSGRKPKIIQPINTTPGQPAITSFTDDEPTEPTRETLTPIYAAAEVESPDAVEHAVEGELPVPTEPAEEADDAIDEHVAAEIAPPAEPAGPKKSKWRLPIGWPPSKRDWMIIGTAVLLLTATGAAAYSMTHRDVAPVANKVTKKVVKPAPKPITSNLTGLVVADDSVNQRPVTGVMIENSPDARPQSGLDQAGIVFEAVAEGGITRFLAVFQDSQPDYIGPVRSARPYYVQWCLSFDCAYAHVGGSPDGLASIKNWSVKDLDQFSNSGAYHRISSRYAPHNVYTSMAELNAVETSKGYGAPAYTGFSRKADQLYKAPDPAATGAAIKKQDLRSPANSIDFAMSGFYYNPHFDYDAANNTYKRSQAGQPHMEQHKDGAQVQIAPKVVIGMIVPMAPGVTGYSNYQAVGAGDALAFQDGTVTKIRWSKPDVGSPLSFTDDVGKPFGLNAGQTWITAITDSSKATYK